MKPQVLSCYGFGLISYLFISPVAAEQPAEQKLILVEGTASRFMAGDKPPLVDFNKNEVLPYLLNRGWRIVSVHLDPKRAKDTAQGYVVVERERP